MRIKLFGLKINVAWSKKHMLWALDVYAEFRHRYTFLLCAFPIKKTYPTGDPFAPDKPVKFITASFGKLY